MNHDATINWSNILENSMKGYPEDDIQKVQDRFVAQIGGTNVYIPKTKPLNKLKRNMNIIAALPRCGEYCSKSKVLDLAKKYDLSTSQVYRIRREAKNTYLQLEELYDHSIITEEQHAKYIAILKKKIPSYELGKSLK